MAEQMLDNQLATDKPATILLVEDNESLLNGIYDLLDVADLGYQLKIVTAVDGQAGLEAVAESEPDLIISDIMMPRMDGFQLLQAVRDNPDWIHIPIIFLTAKGKEQDVLEGRLSGAELYITKPFNSEELIELVKSQLDRAYILRGARQRDLDSLKQNILQILNHEFRTPLTYVTAYYEMLSVNVDNQDGSDDLNAYLRGIQIGCGRLTSLVDDLIKVVELRTGDAGVQFEQRARPFDSVAELFRQAAQAHEKQAASAGVTLHSDIPVVQPTLYGDPDSLKDAMSRLIDNAIKFTQYRRSADKQVWLRLIADDREVQLVVQDTGIGFPGHIQSQLFEPFYQHNRSTMEQQGSGSGLTIARGIVELHRGRITAESEEGQGSTFRITLPIHDPGHSWTGPLPSTSESREATVLIVEDDRYLLEGLREILELVEGPYRFKVHTAANGRKGLQVLERAQPDLIVSDIMMPHMDGYEFLTAVRQNPNWVQIPFIFLTARGERRERHKGLVSGVAEYIAKPYDSDHLVDVINAQLHRHFQVQGVLNNSFGDIKRSILTLLRPDFRQPLDTVSIHSQKLADSLQGAKTDADLKNSLRSIQTSSRQLTQLVEDFISLAEIRTGQARASYLRRAQLLPDPGMLLMEAVQGRQLGASRLNVTLHYEHTGVPGMIYCHGPMLAAAFGRLIDAAVRLLSSEVSREIYLSVEQQDDEIAFRLHHPGGALTQQVADNLAALFQSPDASVLELPGHGPSLTIVKEVVELHDGRIWLANEPDSLTITIALPIRSPEGMLFTAES